MPDYARYYDLWRAIAAEFGVPDARLMQLGKLYPFEKLVKRDEDEIPVPGHIIFYHPYKNPLGPPVLQFRPDAVSSEEGYPGEPAIHYEWLLHSRSGHLDVALHLQLDDPVRNRKRLDRMPLAPDWSGAGGNLQCKKYSFPDSRFFREGWSCIRFRLPCNAAEVRSWPERIAPQAGRIMEHLIASTWGFLS